MRILTRSALEFSRRLAKVACGRRQYWLPLLLLLLVQLASAQVIGGPVVNSPLMETGRRTDFAIFGPGFFMVRDPDSSLLYVTRYGQFFLDVNGFLVTSEGLRVQGFSDATLTNRGDLYVGISKVPGGNLSPVEDYQIDLDGTIHLVLTDGNKFVGGQILLQNPSRPELLRKAGAFIYHLDPAMGGLPSAQPPGTNGLGLLQGGSLEPPVATVALNQVQGPAPLLTHGLLHQTGVPTDFGIEGNGYFILRDPESKALFATRAGAFELDTNGYLVNYSGLRVQGFSDDHLAEVGDIHLNLMPPLSCVSFKRSGKVLVTASDGTTFTAGQILLRDCLQPAQLVRTNFSLYPLHTNGLDWSPLTVPEQSGLGWIAAGCVEPKQFDASLLAARRKLNYFSQGSMQSTTNPTALAINGLGFFSVRNPADNSFYATRDGNFALDAAGHLVTTNGWRLQGLTDLALSQPGDLVIDASQRPPGPDAGATLSSFAIGNEGHIAVLLTDGTSYLRAQITLQYFQNPQALQFAGGNYFTNLAAAGPITCAAPDSSGLGSLAKGALENIPSCQLPELEPLPQSGFRIQANNLLAGATTIESSADLIHWKTLGTVTANDLGAAEFFDPNEHAISVRFYRTRVVP